MVEKGKKDLEWSIRADEEVNSELEASSKLLVDKIDVVTAQRKNLNAELEKHQVLGPNSPPSCPTIIRTLRVCPHAEPSTISESSRCRFWPCSTGAGPIR